MNLKAPRIYNLQFQWSVLPAKVARDGSLPERTACAVLWREGPDTMGAIYGGVGIIDDVSRAKFEEGYTAALMREGVKRVPRVKARAQSRWN